MGTIFQSENSGMFALVVGMIALVMFGVLVTMIMDGSVGFGGDGDIRGALATQRAELENLRQRKKSRQADKDEFARLRAVSRQAREVRGEVAEAETALKSLQGEVSASQNELDKLTGEFDEYRNRYRASVWRRASGEELGDLTTLRGKVYRNARVHILSATEMRIRHEGGPASVQVTDLPPEVRERYHLDIAEAVRIVQARKERAEEKRRALAARREQERLAEEEQLREEEAAAGRRRPRGRRPALTKEEEAKLIVLRTEVNRMYVDMGALRRKLATARSQRGGPDRSPPGSLQTWEQRIGQLTRQEAKGWEVIRAKEDELRRLDPSYVRPSTARGRQE